MRALLRRMAIGFFSGALGALAALVLASLLGRAQVGPAQLPLGTGMLLASTAAGGLWGLAMALFLGMHWSRVILAGCVLGFAPGVYSWWFRTDWPLAHGAWAPLWIVGYWILWGFFTGLLCAWLGDMPAPGGGGGKGRRR